MSLPVNLPMVFILNVVRDCGRACKTATPIPPPPPPQSCSSGKELVYIKELIIFAETVSNTARTLILLRH